MSNLRWQPIATLLLSVYGLGASIYLTITHFQPKALACVSNSTFNCEKVTQSPQSEIFGIPVAMLGLVFFVRCSCCAFRQPGGRRTAGSTSHESDWR
jgi:uncharacterized membrane protein